MAEWRQRRARTAGRLCHRTGADNPCRCQGLASRTASPLTARASVDGRLALHVVADRKGAPNRVVRGGGWGSPKATAAGVLVGNPEGFAKDRRPVVQRDGP